MSSLRERVLPMAVGLGSCIMLALIDHFSSVPAFAIVSAGWLAILIVLFLRLEHRGGLAPTLPILIGTWLAALSILTISEWRLVTVGILAIAGVSTGYLMRIHGRVPSPSEWPVWRRVLMMLLVFDTYALVTALFAVYLFFPAIPFWFLALVGSLLMSASALFIWQLYGYQRSNQVALPLCIVALASAECIWAIHFLPFEYGTFGLILSWLWYLMQLFLRWHMSPADVVWQKQRWFLLINLAFMVSILIFYIRWV